LKKLIITIIIVLSGFCNSYSQWVKVCDTYSGAEGFADNGSYIYAVLTGDGVYRSTNDGVNWKLVHDFGSNNLNSIAAIDSFVFVASDTGIFRSSDYGINWTNIKNWQLFALTIAESYILAGSARMIRSSDWGENWSIVDNELPTSYYNIFTLSSSNGYIYAGNTLNGTGIYKTTDLGNNWNLISTSFMIYSKSLYSYNSLILSGGSEEVAISTDYGNNWRHIAGMQNVEYLFGFASNGTKDIFISSWSRGFYVSNDSGQTWHLKNEGLGSLYPTALHRFGNYLYISLNPWLGIGGIYRRPINEVIGVKSISSEIPNSSKLYQNYPNPFNSMTNVQWTMSRTGYVKIEVFDITGKEITTLVNEKQNAGVYKVMFDAGSLPSGIYFYRIQAGDFTQVKRMILVK
jgi:photosystem II stability/assembly factor-like uncharacterized protein